MRWLAGILAAVVAALGAFIMGRHRKPSHIREADLLARKNLRETTDRETEKMADAIRDAEAEISKAEDTADEDIEKARSGGLAGLLRRRNKRSG